jgi:hypothetical protein
MVAKASYPLRDEDAQRRGIEKLRYRREWRCARYPERVNASPARTGEESRQRC